MINILLLLACLLVATSARTMRPDTEQWLQTPTSIHILHHNETSDLSTESSDFPLSPSQQCHSCHTTIVQFYRFLLSSIHKAEYTGTLDSEGLKTLFCSTAPFDHFKPYYSAGCRQSVADFDRLMAPWIGDRVVGDLTKYTAHEMVEHKQKMCTTCDPSFLSIIQQKTNGDDCKSCEAVAYELAWLIERDAHPDDSRSLDYILKSMCADLAIHTTRPVDAEGFCRSLLYDPDWRKGVNTSIIFTSRAYSQSTENADADVLALYRPLREQICVKLTDSCTVQKHQKSANEITSNKEDL